MHPILSLASASALVAMVVFVGAVFLKKRSRRDDATINASNDPREDRAIEQSTNDALDRSPFVESLVRALVRSEVNSNGTVVSRHSTGFVIGLTGRWGIGKSSILNLVHEKLRATDGVAVAHLNPWLFNDRDELLRAYFNALRDAMGNSTNENLRVMLDYLERYRKAIDWVGKASAVALDAHGAGGSGVKVWSWISKLLYLLKRKPPRSPEAERKALESKLASSNVAVVVLIDELDRVEDSEVRSVAQLIKAVGDIRGVSYLIAYDPLRVAEALGKGEVRDDKLRNGEQYLEKIIQFPIPVRPLFINDVDALLAAAIHYFGVELKNPNNENQGHIIEYIKSNIDTPRDVKRLIGVFSVLVAAIPDEMCAYDVLGYSWILIRSPTLRDGLAQNIQRLVDDPDERESIARAVTMMDRDGSKPTLEIILGAAAEPHLRLLKLLFPRFDGKEDGEGDRISRRRNLTRLLYHGNPPGMIRRNIIEEIWNNPNVGDQETELRRVLIANEMPKFLDRLDDLLPTLSTAGDTTFWVAIARVFVRQTDWIHQVESTRQFAEDAAGSLMRLGLRHPASIPRVKQAIAALVTSSDLTLVPWILRKHLFAHNLTVEGVSVGGRHVLTKEETSELLDLETPRYFEAVENGIALRRLAHAEAIFVLLNAGRWTAELREALTSQLINVNAIKTIAALFVPPGIIIARNSLDQLFDANVVAKAVESILSNTEGLEVQWVFLSVYRLRAILRGEDPMFIDIPA